MGRPKTKIALFLGLTILFSLFVWVPLATGREPLLPGQFNALALMWAPGLAAIVTRLVTQRDLRGMGWLPRTPAILLLALILPVLYAAPVYLIAWASGLAGFDPNAWSAPGQSPLGGLGMLVGLGVLTGLVATTGEELGWRGLLVPELARIMSFPALALVSGVIWASWHTPMMFLAGYGEESSVVLGLACFYLMITALGTIMAWMTLRTRSFWPAALLHATHNLFVQTVFDSATTNGESAAWWTGEFGVGLVITLWLTVLLLVRFGGRVQTARSN